MNCDRQIKEIIHEIKNRPHKPEESKGFLSKLFSSATNYKSDPSLVELAKEEIDAFVSYGAISSGVAEEFKTLEGKELFDAHEKIMKIFRDQGVNLKSKSNK